MFNKPRSEIIKEILESGVEQKDIKTRSFELKQTEIEIVNFVQGKVLKGGRHLSADAVKKLLHGMNIEVGNSKIQAQRIVRKLVEMGYEKVRMTIEVHGEENVAVLVERFGAEKVSACVLKVNTDVYPDLQIFCAENAVRFRILHEEEEGCEDVC